MNAVERGRGVVLAAYGRGALVHDGLAPRRCGLVGRRLKPVCGDVIGWRRDSASLEPQIESIEPRRNCLERIDSRGRPEPVAANIDRVAIVVAPEPRPDWFLVDRYWAAALHHGIEAILLVNKCDLAADGMAEEIACLQGLGLPCLTLSCRTGEGIDVLRAATGTGATLIVGQSGVGKSSLVNRLAPEAAATTATLGRDREGRHTTTTARRYSLSDRAAIVDAPGVRDFAPPARLDRAAEHGFVEIRSRSADCRFADCRHLEEPDCAVRSALSRQEISARRYESYRRLARLYAMLAKH